MNESWKERFEKYGHSLEAFLDNGYSLLHAHRGQIFTRDGWYLEKSINGEVKDIFYVDELISQERQLLIQEAVECAMKVQFKMDVEKYLKMVKAWDGKDFDVPFDYGWNACREEMLSKLKELV